jgi:cysteine-rich repeat protein
MAVATLAGCAVAASVEEGLDDRVGVLDAGATASEDDACSSFECFAGDASALPSAVRRDAGEPEPGDAGDAEVSAPPDNCPDDPDKTEPGVCGCGVAEVTTDTDGDGTLDCNDPCPEDPNKIEPGECGCGAADEDRDNDRVLDCHDACAEDANKIAPGACGCGTADWLDGEVLVCSCASGLQYVDGDCVAKCGDGLVAPDEQCDDGNANDNDDCTNACELPRCGDGILWNAGRGAEACDDGNDINTDGCVLCKAPACGDGWVQSGVETCDGDGKGKGGETLACGPTCKPTYCGDGKINGTDEQCDGDGRGQGGQTSVCDRDCSLAACGDGVVNVRAGEYCDHGGTPTKACDYTCHAQWVKLGTETSTALVDDTYANGSERKRPCESGMVARGIFGRAGERVDSLGVVCQEFDDMARVLKDTRLSGTVGSSSGGTDSGRLMCPGEELLVGVRIRYDAHIRRVEGLCRPGSEILADFTQAAGTHSGGALGVSSGTSKSTTLVCPDGRVVTGIAGHEGTPTKYTSSVKLLCREMQWDL